MILLSRPTRPDAVSSPRRGSAEWPIIPPDAPLLPLPSSPRWSPKRMARYAVQGKRTANAEDSVVAILEKYVAACDEAGLDSLLVVSQLLLETDKLTSASRQLCLNPVDLRLTKPDETEPWFSSWPEAARAHAGLLLAYALPAGRGSPAQLRLLEGALEWRAVPQKLRGSAQTLERLAGTWTADQDYLDKVVDIADSITQPQY